MGVRAFSFRKCMISLAVTKDSTAVGDGSWKYVTGNSVAQLTDELDRGDKARMNHRLRVTGGRQG
ncbi:MAG: hypothetical protein JRN33_00765 [Nitrososphaerota archaeon]|jgi:hypothetical protein|nr:hypothetical protein [Nitrososphaerota archaeon]